MRTNRRRLQLVSSSLNKRISNNSILKATVVGFQESVTKAVDEEIDATEKYFSGSTKNLLRPPFPLEFLTKMSENSSQLGPCIEVMETNIEGFGGRLKPVLDQEALKILIGSGESTDTKNQKSMRRIYLKEWLALDGLFNNPNPDDNLTTLRRKTRKDIESNGNGYWEIVTAQNNASEIVSINQVASHTIMLSKLQAKKVIVKLNQLQPDSTYKTKMFKKQFRKFAQVIGHNKFMWFKEWNDPRIMDKRTGEYVTGKKLNELSKDMYATGLMWFRIHSPRTPYGLPRYIGNMFEIFGSRAAGEINFFTFKNNNMPSMVVAVSGGGLTDDSVTRIEEFVESHIKNSSNRSAFLILEADTDDEGLGTPGTVKIDITPLTKSQHTDELFQNYDKNNRDKVRETFRFSAIFLGRGDLKNANEDKKLAEEQVFTPERDEIDRRINQLVSYMGITLWKFKSNSMAVTQDDSLTKIISSGEKTGGVTPNLAREVIGNVLNTDLPPLKAEDDFDPEVPMSLNLMRLSSQAGGAPGGNAETGPLAPNQGQVPTKSNNQLAKIAEKLLDGEVDEAIDLTLKMRNRVEVLKVERQPGESFSECVDRGMPKLIGEGMKQDQAFAAASSMCKKSKKKSFMQELEDLEFYLEEKSKEDE